MKMNKIITMILNKFNALIAIVNKHCICDKINKYGMNAECIHCLINNYKIN